MADSPNNFEDERNPGARHATELLDREKSADPLQDQRDAFEKEFGGDNFDKNSSTSGSEILAQREADPMNYTGSGGTKKKRSIGMRMKGLFTKKRSAVATVLAVTGIGGVGLLSVFSPAGMLVNLMDSATFKNDASSTALEQRFMKVFGNLTNPDDVPDQICSNATKNIKCKMGRISFKALRQLEARGITASFGDIISEETKGYPDRNPTKYIVDIGNGQTQDVDAKDMASFLAKPENRKLAARVLGVGGAFNVRQKAWIGKHITEKFYKLVPGLDRKARLADGKQSKFDEAMKKLQALIPGNEALNNVSADVSKKIGDRMEKASKGGSAYVAAVGGCVAVKAPSYISAGVAAVQLGQGLPLVMDLILSPGSKMKASAFGSGFTSEDMSTIGTILTERVDGRSALDSPYLQAAIGANKNKVKVSSAFAPGYSVLTDDLVVAARDAEKATESSCNAIMSPTAMYTAMAADIAVTVAASTTLVGGLVKVAAGAVISLVATEAAKAIAEGVAKQVLTDLVENDKIATAQGEDLGDALGTFIPAFFSAGAMARHLPAMTQSQVVAFNDMRLENEQFQREMDIASLSPFDTSSQYTFLGSMVRSMQTTAIVNGGYGNPLATLASVVKSPFASLSPSVDAAQYSDEYCSYADAFRVDTEAPETTPAVNVAGLPCAGITRTQATMSTSEALNTMITNGWVDNSKLVDEAATIEEMRGGAIVSGTPLDDFIEACGNMMSGEYLVDAEGCTVKPAAGELGMPAGYEAEEPIESTAMSTDSRSLEAMSVFLLDYQTAQMVNGGDSEEGEASVSATPTGKYSSPVGANHGMSDGFGPRSCSGCSSWHVGLDLLNSADTNVYSFADGVVEIAAIDGWNNIVRIKHADGLISVYFHMESSDILVKKDDVVTSGQQIGKIGNSGDSYGAHLHFELDISQVTDPAVYAGYPKNTAGFAPPGQRIDPIPFMRDQGLPGY